jgi:hypothetical protein
MNPILDDSKYGKFELDRETLFSIAKWGKTLMLIGLFSFIYYFVKFGITVYSSLTDLPDKSFNALYPIIAILIGIAHIPYIVFFLKFYFGISRSLEVDDLNKLNSAFLNLKKGIKWNVASVLFEFMLNLSYEHFAKYFFDFFI